MENQDYLDTAAEQLVNELRPILNIRAVTSNTDLLGKYTEAANRSFVHRIVQPMRVCTGAVLDHPMPPKLRQIDLIIWAPFPLPAIFEIEGFGLVPKSSAFGVIEVKKSNRGSQTDDELESFLADVEARRIVSEPGGAFADYKGRAGICVIAVLENRASQRLESLIEERKVVGIFERRDGETILRRNDILVLVNFLHYVTWRYRVQGSGPDFPQVRLT